VLIVIVYFYNKWFLGCEYTVAFLDCVCGFLDGNMKSIGVLCACELMHALWISVCTWDTCK
jgi:hypothetical protein